MALVAKSLDAATTTGVGSTILFDTPKSNVSMQVSYIGGPSYVSVALEGTLDGTTFAAITTFNSGSHANGAIRSAAGPALLGVRANLTDLDGGSSPAVTATFAAGAG